METTTYEGRRQMDKVKARAAATHAEAEGRKTNALTQIQIAEEREKAADRKRLRKQAAKTKRLEEKAKRREKRAAARKARNERLAAAIGQPLPWVMTVVVTSITFAFPGQFSAVVGLGVIWVLALMVPVFIEGATWAMAWLRKWAVANNKPAGLYTVMTWLFASVAAALNAWHHADEPQLAIVFAASSLFGVAVWEIYMHSQSHAASGRNAEEIRLALLRRITHPRVTWRAMWLRTATIPPLSKGEAWDRAWRQEHGAEPGVKRSILKRFGKRADKVAGLVEQHDELRPTASLAMFDAPVEPVREVPAGKGWMINPEAIGKILTDPANALRADHAKTSATKIEKGAGVPAGEAAQGPRAARTHAAKEQVKPNNPPSVRGRQKAVDEGGSKQSRAARALASETARAATPEQAEAEKNAAREWVLARLRAGQETGWRDVQRYFEKEVPEKNMRMVRGETWCRARIKEADREHNGDPVLHLAATS
ncbi:MULTISPECIES: DUF2637 domain-containing protein [unclassified Streptomyces]|uniref:DUF2637 domain-containing protein n=1 Tax=unclassified Streptomyces TaxID=2593676 RepID=UPI00074703BF|nr:MULTISPECIES: DUF2637 domain-containing protein [unclassified Streptomyces]KUL73960.1 hypothetical protein ADL34_19050 [Streptomyces sp. NRRL WC-3605]KUL74381.1 hypothetical protein ADL33_17985 [Streptomyces sp. NRRL WC-3604]